MQKPELNRREFVKLTAGAGAALAVPSIAFPGESKKMIGIQVGAVSFVDEGTEKVLDILQERGERQHALSSGLHLRARNRRTANSRTTACPITANRNTISIFTAEISRRRIRSFTRTRC